MVKDLVDYQQHRIEALDKYVGELERFILELCDKDCPEDYKRVVKQQILNRR